MNWYLDVLKKYAVFSGRARRKEYWMYFLLNMIVAAVLLGIDLAAGTNGILYGLYLLGTLVPSLAVAVRRLHDTGRSGWMILVGIIPLVGGIILLVFLASEGKPENNAYGVNPKLAPAV
ncbi:MULTISPECIES: DUF805 domain-containing protein [Streptomyces]|uniref:DUF805 domain-containing protein n=1 Tax=Streptomyces solicathayae TaxID=3081768 RepID=A0ABZ0M422_9ACTN|nr:DUF805 domain-containing protein [Streptomyces sp. HUAS YS2]WOX26240.1 DUF805 domain-containing protein [Streptomyces sp. HUAS YS2]